MTRVIDNDNDPEWNEMFLIFCPPGGTVNFTLFDSDAGTFIDGTDDFLGEYRFAMSALAAEGGEWHEEHAPLTGKKAQGHLVFKVRPYSDGFAVTIASATGLKNKDGMFGTSDPYAVLLGLLTTPPDNRDLVSWGTTGVAKNDLNPVWGESFVVSCLGRVPARAGGIKLAPMVVRVFDHDDGIMDSTDDHLGTVTIPWNLLFPPHGSEARAKLGLLSNANHGGRGFIEVSARSATPDCAAIGDAGRAMLQAHLGGGVGAATMTATVTDVYGAPPPAPVYAPPPPPPQPMMSVQVPPGVLPGAMLIVQAPSGQQLQVAVPAGVMPGMHFQVAIPPAPAAAAMPPPAAPMSMGGGKFISTRNGDRMLVQGTMMQVFNAASGTCIATALNVAMPAFVAAFPWGQVAMTWNGGGWVEAGAGPPVQWVPAQW